jgi:hypothetical protein
MSCKEADVDHFVAASAATNQEMCKDGSTQPERGQSSCTEIDTSPVFAMGAAAAAALIVLILVYTQSQKKEAPKSRKKIDTDLGHLGDQKRKPRKKRSPEGRRRKRGKRPPEGKRKKRPPNED